MHESAPGSPNTPLADPNLRPHRSQAICSLLADEARLTQERAQAAQRKRQYTGYARDDLGQPQQFRTLSEISLPAGPDGSLPSPLRRTVGF